MASMAYASGRDARDPSPNEMVDINDLVERTLRQRALVPKARSLLVGISGIDGSGKGYVTREQRQHFDLTIWVDCSFSTALSRALERRQEGLPPAATIRAYDTIYFPAQKIHIERDRPRESADVIINK